MTKPEFVMFDCDGVLVDSEYLAAQINAELLTEAGYPIEAKELSERYAGFIFADALKAIEKEADIPLSASILDKSAALFLERLKTDLVATEGIRKAVESLTLPYCLCSNSGSDNIKAMLTTVGLYDLFRDKIFSAPEVGSKRGKPAPDVFLYAAEHNHVDPARVIVVEDSVTGITAAKAAGMRVIGYTGARHSYFGHADALTDTGAETVITRHADLAATIAAMSEWRD